MRLLLESGLAMFPASLKDLLPALPAKDDENPGVMDRDDESASKLDCCARKEVDDEELISDFDGAGLEELLLAFVGEEELYAFQRKAEDMEEGGLVGSWFLIASIGVAVSDGSHCLEGIGAALPGEHSVSGEFQGPWRIVTVVGRATADATKKPTQYTSIILGILTCG